MPDRLKELLAVCDAATEGPWEDRQAFGGPQGTVFSADAGNLLAQTPTIFDGGSSGCFRRVEDATFAATARTALPDALKALVKCREALREARRTLITALDDACDLPDFDPFEHRVVKLIDETLDAIEQVGEGG